MSCQWCWLFLILFLKLNTPQFPLHFSECFGEKCHVPNYTGTGPLEFPRLDGQIPELENLLESTRAWPVNEMDFVHDSTVEKNDLIQKDPHAILQKRKNICLLTDKDVCLEVDRTSPGNASLVHGGELEGDLYLSGALDFTSILCLAQQHMRVFSELFVAYLGEEWQPGHTFNNMAMVIFAVADVITVLVFIWRRVLTVKSRTYQLTEKQLVEGAADITNEKRDAVMKISHLNKKMGEREGQVIRSQIRVSSTQRKNKELKASTTERNQRQGIKQKPEFMHQLHQQVETDPLHKMDQDMLDKSAKLFEIIHGHEQLRKSLIEETNKDLEKTENLFETQRQGIEKQYKDSLSLVSDLQRLNKEYERCWKEEIAAKKKKIMEEGWLKDVVANDSFIMERFEPSWQSEPELQSDPVNILHTVQHHTDASFIGITLIPAGSKETNGSFSAQ